MTRVDVFLAYVVSFILSTVAEPVLVGAGTQNAKARSPRVSSEFGYSIRNTEPSSSQYRQELRDTNGSVKGSYGFEDPNGGYRFVHYVADDNGFRAHISSNEPSVGRQNPASVSINRVEHHTVFADDPKQVQKPPGSSSEQKNVETVPDPSRFELYSPVQRQEHTGVKDYWTLDPFKGSFHRDPVEEYVRSKLGARDDLFGKSSGHPGVESNPASLLAMYHTLAEKKSLLGRSHLTHTPPSSSYPSALSKFLDSNHFTSRRQTEEYQNYHQVMSNLDRSRQRQVLPDCNSASSAILCQPPDSGAETSAARSPSLVDPSVSSYFRSLATRRTAFDRPSVNEYPKGIIPQSMFNSYIPRSYDQNDDSDYDLDSQEDSRRRDCNKNSFLSKNKSPSGTLTLLQRRLFGKDRNNALIPFDGYAPFYGPKNNRNRDSSEHSPALVRFLEDEQNVENLKNILKMKTPQKSTYKKDSPRVSLLGILILPSDILSGLAYKTESKPKDEEPQSTDGPIMPPVLLGLDAAGSGAEDQPDPVEEGLNVDDKNRTSTSTNSLSVDEYVSDTNVSNDRHPASTEMFQDRGNQLSDQGQPTSNKSDSSAKESGFWVFDDPDALPEGDTEDSASPHMTPGDWRKMLEEEIRRDSERQFPLGVASPEADQRQFALNEDESPLYDSTGRPVKRENVPLHIHRLNLPSGMTSLPWKFSIPRPAPPRSVVMPPKPPVLS